MGYPGIQHQTAATPLLPNLVDIGHLHGYSTLFGYFPTQYAHRCLQANILPKEPVILRVENGAPRSIPAHLGRVAVCIVEFHPRHPIAVAWVDHHQPIGTHSEVPIAQACYRLMAN